MPYAGLQRSNYAAGDYYGGVPFRRGDPGILGSLFKGVTGAIGGFLGSGLNPLGAITGAVRGITGGSTPAALPSVGTIASPQLIPMQAPVLQMPAPIKKTTIGPAGMVYSSTTYPPAKGVEYIQDANGNLVMVRRKRKRMNVANPRALRRALRRVAGFGKLASRARRDIGRAATAVGAHRRSFGGGSRGVITRSEAARALRK